MNTQWMNEYANYGSIIIRTAAQRAAQAPRPSAGNAKIKCLCASPRHRRNASSSSGLFLYLSSLSPSAGTINKLLNKWPKVQPPQGPVYLNDFPGTTQRGKAHILLTRELGCSDIRM